MSNPSSKCAFVEKPPLFIPNSPCPEDIQETPRLRRLFHDLLRCWPIRAAGRLHVPPESPSKARRPPECATPIIQFIIYPLVSRTPRHGHPRYTIIKDSNKTLVWAIVRLRQRRRKPHRAQAVVDIRQDVEIGCRVRIRKRGAARK